MTQDEHDRLLGQAGEVGYAFGRAVAEALKPLIPTPVGSTSIDFMLTEESRERFWTSVYVKTIGVSSLTPAEEADAALAEFDKRFGRSSL